MSDKIIKVKNGTKHMRAGWTRITIRGGPKERGFAHGQLMKEEFDRIMVTQDYVCMDSYGYTRKALADVIPALYSETMRNKYPEVYEEIEGIHAGLKSRGSKYTLNDVILWNLFYTIGYMVSHLPELVHANPELNEKYGHIFAEGGSATSHEGGAGDKCSAFIAVGDWTKDGKIVCAHNTFDNFIDAQFESVILEIKPTKGHNLIMQTAPCQVSSGTDYYVAGNTFIVTETTIGGFMKFKLADPITCRIRKAVQYANSLDEYDEILSDGNGGDYANSWLIGDTKTNEIMRIELGLDYKKVEKKKNGYFIGYNAPTDAKIRNLECINTGYRDIRRHQGARQVRLEQLMTKNKGQIDVERGQLILADHYDVYLNKINMCSRTCCSHYELDDRAFMSQSTRPLPYQPRGAVDGCVTDSSLAKDGAFTARWGTSCGTPFYAKAFCKRNIQWADQEPYLLDRPHQPWALFRIGESKGKSSRGRSHRFSSNKTRRRR
jgi:hypothetical protein